MTSTKTKEKAPRLEVAEDATFADVTEAVHDYLNALYGDESTEDLRKRVQDADARRASGGRHPDATLPLGRGMAGVSQIQSLLEEWGEELGRDSAEVWANIWVPTDIGTSRHLDTPSHKNSLAVYEKASSRQFVNSGILVCSC